jgi:hypothetical protein
MTPREECSVCHRPGFYGGRGTCEDHAPCCPKCGFPTLDGLECEGCEFGSYDALPTRAALEKSGHDASLTELRAFAARMASLAGFTAMPRHLTPDELEEVAKYIEAQVDRLEETLSAITEVRQKLETLAP